MISIATQTLAACALAAPALAHVSLEVPNAPAGSTYKAVFQVSHGCQGSATTGVSVQIPAGFVGAKPMPKAGWTLAVQQGALAKPDPGHDKPAGEEVAVVRWTAAGKDAALQDAHFDVFVLRGKVPQAAGPLWFKVLQTCENGSIDWSEVPASGTSLKTLKSPAVLLEVTGTDRPAAPAPARATTPATHQH